MQQIIFIVGPTATGKSQAAFLLAKELGGEIISCDSMLIYKEPEIITAKPENYILEEVRHHFVGVVSVSQTYNVFDYYKLASEKIKELQSKGIPVIVCGGSGLYMKALCDGIFQEPEKNLSLRRKLEQRIEKEGLEVLYQELAAVDPQAAEKISSNDSRRIIRALEVYYASGIPISAKQSQAQGLCDNFSVKIFGLRLERKTLYERINERTDEMFARGAIDEVRDLLKLSLSLTAEKIIGIKEIGAFLDGKISEKEAVELMKKNTRNFAKRQLTWFRKDKRIEWIDIDDISPKQLKEQIVKRIH
jgi:tRNA dimethylallyltransferase